MFRNLLKKAVLAVLLNLLMVAIAQAATVSLLLPGSTAFSILGASCGGIQEQAFATGFDANGDIAGEVYLQTRCGGSGRGGGYKSHTYYAWVAVTWNLQGAVIDYYRLASSPSDYSPVFSAFDANNDEIYNQLSAVNVQPANCTVGNTTYCRYRAYLLTP